MCTKWFNMDDVKALEEYMAVKITRRASDSDCTNCLWEYMCDWNKDNCDYIPDRS